MVVLATTLRDCCLPLGGGEERGKAAAALREREKIATLVFGGSFVLSAFAAFSPSSATRRSEAKARSLTRSAMEDDDDEAKQSELSPAGMGDS